MEVSVRPITVTEELAAVGRTRARRCRAALIERDTDGDDRAGTDGLLYLSLQRPQSGTFDAVGGRPHQQPKAVMFPTDAKLMNRAREIMVPVA